MPSPSPLVRLADGLVLDLSSDELRDDGLRVWVGGESGSGKSWATSLITGQVMQAGRQVVVLDAHGEYGGLFALAMKRTLSFGYGGPELAVEDAEACVAEVAAGKNLLLDLSHWTDVEPGALTEFSLSLARGLMRLRRQDPRFTLLVVEEAQNVIPQAQLKGQNENVLAFVGLVTGGRKFGLHCLLATQQQALVDSRALSGCNVRLFMRASDWRDWKKVQPFVPARLKVDYDGKKTGIRHFKSGEALVLSRWLPESRVMLNRPMVEPQKFLVR